MTCERGDPDALPLRYRCHFSPCPIAGLFTMFPPCRQRCGATGLLQVYYSASLQKQRIQDAMTQGLYEKTRDSQEVRRRSSFFPSKGCGSPPCRQPPSAACLPDHSGLRPFVKSMPCMTCCCFDTVQQAVVHHNCLWKPLIPSLSSWRRQLP